MKASYSISISLAQKHTKTDIHKELQQLSIPFPQWLETHGQIDDLPPYLSEVVRLETAIEEVRTDPTSISRLQDNWIVNPSLKLVTTTFTNLVPLLLGEGDKENNIVPGGEHILIWRRTDDEIRFKVAEEHDLLALKLVAENINLEKTAEIEQTQIGLFDRALTLGNEEQIILRPETRLIRNPAIFSTSEFVDKSKLKSNSFTLQWHITQACDLHCKHCYDRTSRTALPLDEGIRILDDLRTFCNQRHVGGHVTFTGGNPLLYPHFKELYQAAADHGFELAILGNPASKETMAELTAIKPMKFFQVSLEGLEQHNNDIRGKDHFKNILNFLDILKELDIYSMVMLTLTRANQDQVLELAELLRDKVDRFSFNRLSMVGEGASLQPIPTDNYREFLADYVKASIDNPSMGYKDNHLNTLFTQEKQDIMGGCTGFGCGAAFNFITLLAEGEVHACRKLPSYLGDITKQSFSEIYDSAISEKYRNGCSACNNCPTRPVCGGCLAVTYGLGLDIFKDKDPYCFADQS